MTNVNERIIKEGTILRATKLPVITIGIGQVSKLRELPGTIWRNNEDKVVIATKEAPEGCVYEQERTAVVRVIGGKVKMNGLYDIYAPNINKIDKLLSNRFELQALAADLLKELKPILNVASEVCPSLAPAEYGRKVIVITEKMVGKHGYIDCHCPWDPDDVLTHLYVGDVFLVEDEENCQGYRIGREEFAGTHKI